MTQTRATGRAPSRAGRLGARLAAVVVLAGAVVVLLEAIRIAGRSGVAPQQSGFFPIVVAVGLTACALAFLVRATIWQDEELAVAAAEQHAATHWLTLWIVVAGLVAYVLLLEPLGYVVATAVFFAGMAMLVGDRRPVRDIAVAIIFAVVVYLGFTELFGVRLPAGVLDGVL